MSKLPFEDDRFWAKVQFTDSCWLWNGCIDSCGYGVLMRAAFKKNPARSHRYSFWMAYGVDPAEMIVMHKCDTPACVRPDHLKLGTVADNVADMSQKARHGKISLSNHDVKEIIKRFHDGEKGKDLAREYKVSPATISRYVNGVRRDW